MIGEAFLNAWSGYGVHIIKEKETPDEFIIYISVPETSEFKDANHKMMAGENLSRKIKASLTDVGMKRLTVKCKIRKGDRWTQEKKSKAEQELRKNLFESNQ